MLLGVPFRLNRVVALAKSFPNVVTTVRSSVRASPAAGRAALRVAMRRSPVLPDARLRLGLRPNARGCLGDRDRHDGLRRHPALHRGAPRRAATHDGADRAGRGGALGRRCLRGLYRLAELRSAAEPPWDGLDIPVVLTVPRASRVAELEADAIGPNAALGTYDHAVHRRLDEEDRRTGRARSSSR